MAELIPLAAKSLAAAELRWFTPSGTEMAPSDWDFPGARSLALYLDGADNPDRDADGTPLIDDDFLLLLNGWWEPLDFAVPPTDPGETWEQAIDTYEPQNVTAPVQLTAGDHLTVHPRSILLLRGHST